MIRCPCARGFCPFAEQLERPASRPDSLDVNTVQRALGAEFRGRSGIAIRLQGPRKVLTHGCRLLELNLTNFDTVYLFQWVSDSLS